VPGERLPKDCSGWPNHAMKRMLGQPSNCGRRYSINRYAFRSCSQRRCPFLRAETRRKQRFFKSEPPAWAEATGSRLHIQPEPLLAKPIQACFRFSGLPPSLRKEVVIGYDLCYLAQPNRERSGQSKPASTEITCSRRPMQAGLARQRHLSNFRSVKEDQSFLSFRIIITSCSHTQRCCTRLLSR
jgi:hypothetical protein